MSERLAFSAKMPKRRLLVGSVLAFNSIVGMSSCSHHKYPDSPASQTNQSTNPSEPNQNSSGTISKGYNYEQYGFSQKQLMDLMGEKTSQALVQKIKIPAALGSCVVGFTNEQKVSRSEKGTYIILQNPVYRKVVLKSPKTRASVDVNIYAGIFPTRNPDSGELKHEVYIDPSIMGKLAFGDWGVVPGYQDIGQGNQPLSDVPLIRTDILRKRTEFDQTGWLLGGVVSLAPVDPRDGIPGNIVMLADSDKSKIPLYCVVDGPENSTSHNAPETPLL